MGAIARNGIRRGMMYPEIQSLILTLNSLLARVLRVISNISFALICPPI